MTTTHWFGGVGEDFSPFKSMFLGLKYFFEGGGIRVGEPEGQRSQRGLIFD